jgi:hypothetical protein
MTGLRRGMRIIVVALLCLLPARVRTLDVSIPNLKAAFLINFVKFAEWPEGSPRPGQPFTFCVAGDLAVFEALDGIIKQQTGRRDGVGIYVGVAGPFQNCQLLYLGGIDARDWRAALDALQHAPIFTVGDARGFAEGGGIAELKLDSGKMRFNINPGAAQRARLVLSAKLLSLATLVHEKSHESR